MKTLTRQRGFNIIELMVSVAISMLVLAGLATMFGTQRSSARTQDSVGQVQESARFALQTIADSVKQTGFQVLNVNLQAVRYYGDDDWNTIYGAAPVAIVNGNPSDALTVRFQSATAYNAVTGTGGDCTGAAPAIVGAAPAQIANTYSRNANNQLVCTNGAGVQVVLVNGVLDFQIRAGISATANSDDDSVAAYVDAAALLPAQVAQIRSVEVCLVLQSENLGGETSASNDRYMGCAGPVLLAARDGRIRQVFRQTMVLRNAVSRGV